jgi:3-hydroxyacyl-CoA dehydrogenase
MGPLALADFIGLDTCLAIMKVNPALDVKVILPPPCIFR